MDPAFAVVGDLGEAAEKLGILLAAAATVGALLIPRPRLRAFSIAAALVLTAIVLVGHIWNNPQFRSISGDALLFAALLVCALGVVGLLALQFLRRPQLFPLLAVAALPFRIPIEAGGSTSNLLVPLYLVIAAAAGAQIMRELRDRPESQPNGSVRLLEFAFASFVALYAIQSLYSRDFETALEQMVFFYVPFALLFKLLTGVRWNAELLFRCGLVLLVLALVFSGIGFWEYERRELFWNPKVIRANQFESYFRVNSVFWDPNVFGRFLAIVMVAVAAVMLWSRRRRNALLAALALAVLWGGLVLTFSQSSIASLLIGLAVVAALRWNPRRALAASVLVAALAGLFVLAFQDALNVRLGSSSGLNKATSGRADLVEGGVNLFLDRPLWGYGSGSFARTFRQERKGNQQQAVSASHTLPITVAAEQGLLGLAAYLLVLFAAFRMLLERAWVAGLRARDPPPALESPDGSPLEREALAHPAAGAALAGAFTALVVHTMMYAAFLEDPLTWVILAVASAVPALRRRAAARDRPVRSRVQSASAAA
jgi:O-antigen ligase/polysaccharide polymerase Wzy-like membrane protein